MQKILTSDPRLMWRCSKLASWPDLPWSHSVRGGNLELPRHLSLTPMLIPVHMQPPHTGATPACADSQVNLCEGSIVAAGSEQQAAATRPKTRLQNNITQPKSFGDDFVHLVTNTGEPRDFA
jgi:hypothetical protein